MTSQRVVTAYRQTEVQSRTPLELVVMLYDGGLKFLHQTREAIARGDIRARRDASARALAIVSELQNTLNMDEGGDVARQLDELYSYVNGRILQAAMDNSTAPIDDAARVLSMLRDSWATLASQTDQPVRGAA